MSSQLGQPVSLPLVRGSDTGGERADAARNRQLLLTAAKTLIDDQGAAAVTMDAVAREAGVGKGTVFRRFGSRTGLMMALLDHSEHALQHDYLSGPEPLGPGAPPLDRLIAYGRARLALTIAHLDILLEAGSDDPDRLNHPAWRMSTLHVQYLLSELGYPGGLDTVAIAIQAPLEAIAVRHVIEVIGLTAEQIADDWERMVRLLAAGLR
ncbi:TetR/AcrR family transcriptional regulator [Gordonia sp. (in: high G+C Gram-positive bacteria)]|uniref:TetR/AcrR family transcriptional regulator n=1 Tax=Gordonia sp. (in: high G+C Gram-positive bacteria) TaxID=84139 RepID=UPI003527BB42